MNVRSAMSRGLVAMFGALVLGACGGEPSAEAGAGVPMDEAELTTVDSSLGQCPGYDSCANWSPWYAVGGSYCGANASTCGSTWVCEEDPWGCPYGVAPEATVSKDGQELLPPCCGILYREPNPALIGTQERYRVCFNPAGASCTDYEQASGGVLSCGC
ncbi:hypothetical protein [Myxococcus sp. AB025B]|uniref:hypothetical protein n=1 Tax=Myxococcus sp. AB025B TaxID=2562794 RepID=UPI001144E102|nr:hypothetical protein [Myxococcus sp. AB025B]